MLFSYSQNIRLIKGSNVHKSKINKISLAVCLAFMPIYGFTAGLGKLSVDSGLGEPLKAQIDLLEVTPEELSTLTATVASEEAYALQGIPRLGVHSNIRVELIKNRDGFPALRLRSQQPIDDPYLDMLIQVDWASGRLLREYTILLDPPGYKQLDIVETSPVVNKPATEVFDRTTPKSDSAASTSSKVSALKSKTAQKSAATESKPIEKPESSTEAAEVSELTTQRGDTLNSIAKEHQIEGVSLDQMLVGLFEANKKAFVDGNMNRLKVGQIIRIPSKEVLTAQSAKQATQEVKVHSDNWNAYRNSLAGNVIAAPVAEETEQKQSASGKITTAEDKAAAVKPGAQDVVKLSAGGAVAAKTDNKAAAQADAKILALQEEATAREKALKEAQERTAALETQIADMQKLLALKSQTMADMQKNADAAATPVVKEQQPQAQAPAQPSAPSVDTQASVTPAPTSAEVKITPEVKAPAPAAQQADNKAAAPQKPLPQPAAPVEEPSLFDSILESVNLLALGGAGGVALLGAGWMYLRNKRRRDLDSFERGILTSGGLRANTVFGNTTGNATGSADTSFLTDFAQSADGSMIDTHDVDPIAEAEVYMAYGRDAQAEEILKDAISKEPKRYELHLKLLEMYAARKDASAFETIAGELYTTLGSDDPTWAKVAELGATVEPDNPLYDVSQINVAATKAGEDKSTDSEAEGLDLDSDFDFSLDEKPVTSTTAQSVSNTDNETLAQSESSQVATAGVNPEEQALDFKAEDFNINAVQATSADQKNNAESPAADNSMDFNFPDIGSFVSGAETDLNAVNKLSSEPEAASQQQESYDLSFPDTTENSQEIELKSAVESDQTDAVAALNFSFPETPAEEVDMAATGAASNELSFEGLGGLEVPEEDKIETSALDSLSFQLDETDDASEKIPDVIPEVKALEGISLDLDAEQAPVAELDVQKAADAQSVEEISFEFPTMEQQPAEHEQAASDAGKETNSFDFSSISLDLGETDAQPAAETQSVIAIENTDPDIAETVPQNASENPDVDIKLDLVKVYIDMEDEEGARDLLQEVLKEGGPQQKATAEKLLASLA